MHIFPTFVVFSVKFLFCKVWRSTLPLVGVEIVRVFPPQAFCFCGDNLAEPCKILFV